jgi:hypothetical protein
MRAILALTIFVLAAVFNIGLSGRSEWDDRKDVFFSKYSEEFPSMYNKKYFGRGKGKKFEGRFPKKYGKKFGRFDKKYKKFGSSESSLSRSSEGERRFPKKYGKKMGPWKTRKFEASISISTEDHFPNKYRRKPFPKKYRRFEGSLSHSSENRKPFQKKYGKRFPKKRHNYQNENSVSINIFVPPKRDRSKSSDSRSHNRTRKPRRTTTTTEPTTTTAMGAYGGRYRRRLQRMKIADEMRKIARYGRVMPDSDPTDNTLWEKKK